MRNINLNLLEKINKNEYIVLAVSGGPDSMALLHFLHTNNYKVVIAHVHHNKRKESDYEYKFVKEYANKYNIVFEGTKLDIAIDDNFQAGARDFRYNFFKSLYNKYNACCLMTAHHGDDLIETILMRIIRGSSLNGYSGIKEETTLNEMKVIRPMLKINKDGIYKYLDENNLKYCIDQSNKSNDYTRNRIRNNVLPVLYNENNDVNIKFYEYSKTIEEVNEYLNKQDIKLCKERNNYIIYIQEFNKYDECFKKLYLEKLLKDIYKDNIGIITKKHINTILEIIKSDKKEFKYNFPNGLLIHKFMNKITFTIISREIKGYDYIFKDKLTILSKHYFEIVDDFDDLDNTILINSSEVKFPLRIRSRLDGDKINSLGMKGRKKVKSIFIENNISRDDRAVFPILVDNEDNIIWIPTLKLSKYCKKVSENYDIVIKYKEIDL